MNWDKPYSYEEYEDANRLIMGMYGYKFKKHHTGKDDLTWRAFYEIHPELEDHNYETYIKVCKLKNSKLYKALK